MSRTAATFVAAVPPPFRSEAWRTAALTALVARHPEQAEAFATRAVRASPNDAESVSRLGVSRLFAGDAGGAQAAFRVAGQLGWRDRATQLYWFEAGLSGRDEDVAALRLDALLRQQPDLPGLVPLLARLETTTRGRRALAGRLAASPPWLASYVSAIDGATAEQLKGRAQVLADPRVARLTISCDAIGILSGALHRASAMDTARTVWRQHCGEGDNGLLNDGEFVAASLSGSSSPFAWQFAGKGGLDIRLDGDGRNRAVVVANFLASREVFASQQLQLAPGRYRLGWQARGEDGLPSKAVTARLACRPGEGRTLPASQAAQGAFTAMVEVPAGCPAQWLEFIVAPASGAVRLAHVTLR